MGNPESGLRIFHIGGTNGKGSSSHFVKAMLEAEGYTVGMFTSPHVMVYNERFQISGEMIDDDTFTRLANSVMDYNETLVSEGYGYPSQFEILTASAYLFFAEKNPDYVIMEVGIGGRYDATNTVERPIASLITQIGLDHTDMLGHTIEEITAEKACIIKPNVPIISESPEEEVRAILSKVAGEKGAKFIDTSKCDYTINDYALETLGGIVTRFDATINGKTYEDLVISMVGEHQVRNAIASVAMLDEVMDITEESIRKGLLEAKNPGRFEILQDEPLFILDGAHNPSGVKAAIDTFRVAFPDVKDREILLAFGCLADKECDTMIKQIAEEFRSCNIRAIEPNSERALPSKQLREQFRALGCTCKSIASVAELFAEIQAKDYDVILVLGSIYLIGEVRTYYLNK